MVPLVCLCTPTYNRRRFMPQAIRCFLHQDYPRDRMIWLVVDDGDDSVRDLLEGVRNVHYVRLSTRIPLGRKRNMIHSIAVHELGAEYLVYMDDDDYYPPTRVSHAIRKLTAARTSRPPVLCAGSSIVHTYFLDRDQVVRFGPLANPNHATAGTLAFHKDLLRRCHYEDDAKLAEEKFFLRDFTVPLVQLDPYETILCIAHDSNTVDKNTVLARTTHATLMSVRPRKLIDATSFKFYDALKGPGTAAASAASAQDDKEGEEEGEE
jgi:glycosyltransferase involved in cell wall biosynthesis